jgi:hypothetical protein
VSVEKYNCADPIDIVDSVVVFATKKFNNDNLHKPVYKYSKYIYKKSLT